MKTALIACLTLLLSVSLALAGEPRVQIPVGNSPSLGPEDAPVTVVEFLDFQ